MISTLQSLKASEYHEMRFIVLHMPVLKIGSPGGDSEDALDMSLSTLKFEDSLGLSKDKADLLAFLGSVASPTPR